MRALPKLLPCPFCGWVPNEFDYAEAETENVWCVECPECFARGPSSDEILSDAFDLWNARSLKSSAPRKAGAC